MVVTGDPELGDRARLLREYGWRDRYVSELPGLNSRLDELQAAILRVKLPFLDTMNENRRKLALIYDDVLRGSRIGIPVVHSKAVHVYHQYVVRSDQRNAVRTSLRSQAIGTSIHYPVPVHQQLAYRDRVPCIGSLHHTELAASQVLSLPMYPELRPEEAHHVARAIISWDKKFKG